jgi:hypothetical protein
MITDLYQAARKYLKFSANFENYQPMIGSYYLLAIQPQKRVKKIS